MKFFLKVSLSFANWRLGMAGKRHNEMAHLLSDAKKEGEPDVARWRNKQLLKRKDILERWKRRVAQLDARLNPRPATQNESVVI